MIAWDKTAAQEMVLPDDIWTTGNSKEALFRMEQPTTRQQATNLRAHQGNRFGTATITTSAGGRQRQIHGETTRLPLDATSRSARHRLARTIVGYPGGILAAALSLPAVTAILGVSAAGTMEMVIGTVLLRALTALIRTSGLSHEQGLLRLSAKQMGREEMTFALTFCATAFLLGWPITPAIAGLYLALNFSIQTGMHVAGRTILRNTSSQRSAISDGRALVVGTGARAKQVVDALLDHPEIDMHPSGFLDSGRTGLWRYRDVPLLGRPEALEQLALDGQVDALFVATESHETAVPLDLLRSARKMGITVHVVPGAAGFSAATLEIARLNGFPTLVYRATPSRYTMMVLKRTADILGAVMLTLLASPLMLATALAIKLDSRGPILFKQVRAGRNGRRFNLYKFRTMTCDAEKKKASLWDCNEMSGPVFKIKNDPRVTRIGRYLRRYSVDELPQLFNVFVGEMSLVGPRPPLPSEVLGYEPWQRRKLSVRPGLTCLWQVNGRNAIDFSDWMRLDLEYIDNWSLALDAKILARTIPTVLKGSGV